jgi:hypothetical protein
VNIAEFAPRGDSASTARQQGSRAAVADRVFGTAGGVPPASEIPPPFRDLRFVPVAKVDSTDHLVVSQFNALRCFLAASTFSIAWLSSSASRDGSIGEKPAARRISKRSREHMAITR